MGARWPRSGIYDERLAAIARELVHEPDMQHTLQRIVELAAANLDGEVYASVFLVRQRRQVQTPAASDERATRADQLQYELGEGPCLDAIWQQDTLQIDDMTTEQRYPDWARRVAEQIGIRSSLSLQLFTNEDSLGALNSYSPQLRGSDAERPAARGWRSPLRRRWRRAARGTSSTGAPQWSRTT